MEINETETKNKTIEKINETKSWFFENIHKINKDRQNNKNSEMKQEKLQLTPQK